jgi:hypothetical protein
MARHKSVDWKLPDGIQDWEQVSVAVLMDVRDEIAAVRRLLECYRVSRALDDLHSLGIFVRRRRKRRAPT